MARYQKDHLPFSKFGKEFHPSPLLWVGVFLLILLALTCGIRLALGTSSLGADFYTFWVAGRTAIIDGQSPYSSNVTHQSQMGIVRHAVDPAENQLSFVYPIYSLAALLPVVGLPFEWAQALWMALNLALLVSILTVSCAEQKSLAPLSFLLFYPVFLGLVLGNFTMFLAVIVMIWVTFIFTRSSPSVSWQVIGGVLLAWATIKPQFIWVVLLFALLDALRRKLRPFLAGFLCGGIGCLGISFAAFPEWFSQWLDKVEQYAVYSKTNPVIIHHLDLLFPEPSATWVGRIAVGLLVAATVVILLSWWRGRFDPILALGWCGALGYLLHPTGSAHEQLLFLIPLLTWMNLHGWQKGQHRFWWAAIAFSWVALFLGKTFLPAADQWGVFLFAGWWIWQWLLSRKKMIPQPEKYAFERA